MNGIEKSNRRVEMSAVLSDAVYEYERAYTDGGTSPELMAVGVLKDAGIDDKSYKIVDSMYDEKSGVAAIAVEDKLTGGPLEIHNYKVLVSLMQLSHSETPHRNVLLLL